MVVGVVRMVGVVGVVRMVGMFRMVGVVRMVTLLAEHYFVQISVGRWSLLLDVLWVSCPKNNKVSSLLLTGLLTGVSR